MRYLLLCCMGLLHLLLASAQQLDGEWMSTKTVAYKLQNNTVTRVYNLLINTQKQLLTGQSSVFFRNKTGFLKTELSGSLDSFAHTLKLVTKDFYTTLATTAEKKNFNEYHYQYSKDSVYEYLHLTLQEQEAHTMLDSSIVFFRLLPPKSVAATPTLQTLVKDSANQRPKPALPIAIAQRTNTIFETFVVPSESITIDLYDIGDIDGDSVTLLLNNVVVAAHIRLEAKATSFVVQLQKGVDNTLVLFAENLGTIPPNSAYMVLTAGKAQYKIALQSTNQANAAIVLKPINPL